MTPIQISRHVTRYSAGVDDVWVLFVVACAGGLIGGALVAWVMP